MDLHDYFDPTYRDSEVMELEAIWITEYTIRDENGAKKCRFESGDTLRVEFGKIASGEPTHLIIGCFGTLLSNRLEFMVQDLETQELSIVKP